MIDSGLDRAHWFGIDSEDCVWFTLIVKQYWVYTWIDTGLRNPYGVGHLLHIFPKNYFSSSPLLPPHLKIIFSPVVLVLQIFLAFIYHFEIWPFYIIFKFWRIFLFELAHFQKIL